MSRSSLLRRVATAVLGAALAAGLAGCSSAVPAGSVADTIAARYAKDFGHKPDKVTCAKDLPAEVDARTTCTLTDGDTTVTLRVVATHVEGDKVEFKFKVTGQGSQE